MVARVLSVVGWSATAVASFVAWRFYRRAVVYDEVFQYLHDDIQTNLRQFAHMASSNIMSNEPTVQDAHRKMMTMGMRLNEILSLMEEARGLKMRPPRPPPRPKVV
jgi:hypothetical protein